MTIQRPDPWQEPVQRMHEALKQATNLILTAHPGCRIQRISGDVNSSLTATIRKRHQTLHLTINVQ